MGEQKPRSACGPVACRPSSAVGSVVGRGQTSILVGDRLAFAENSAGECRRLLTMKCLYKVSQEVIVNLLHLSHMVVTGCA